MSAITEYVHYYQKNYDNWGINRVNTIKSDTLSSSFEEIRKKLINVSQINNLIAEAKKIEDDYNQLFFPEKETDFSKMLREVAQETLQQQFGAAAGRVNNASLNVESTQLSSQYKEKVKKVREQLDIANLKQGASAQAILSRIDQLSTVLLNLDDAKNAAILQNRIVQAKKELQQIRKRVQQETGIDAKDFSSDIQSINKLIKQFNRSFTWHNQRGDLFQWLIPLIQLKGCTLSGDALKKQMKKLVGSGNKGAMMVDVQYPDFLNMSDKELNASIDSEKMHMKIANVRSKTDVIIQYEDGSGAAKEFNVSAKSVLGRHVKIVQETSLYRILIFSENYDFIKHYLNIISWSKKGGRASQEQIVQANTLIQGLIMQLGAEGFDLNNPAELLIMHEVKKKRINVYNIKALIYLIQQHLLEGDNKYQRLIQSNSFNKNFTIEQEFEETIEERLNYLFHEINNVKVTAHIYATQLNDYLKVLENNGI